MARRQITYLLIDVGQPIEWREWKKEKREEEENRGRVEGGRERERENELVIDSYPICINIPSINLPTHK